MNDPQNNYCRRCGNKMIHREVNLGYEAATGKSKKGNAWKCPKHNFLFQHDNYDDFTSDCDWI